MMHYNTKRLKCDSIENLYSSNFDPIINDRWYALGVYAADGYNAGNGLSLEVQVRDEAWIHYVSSIIEEWFGIDSSWDYKTLNGRVYVRVRQHSILLSQYFTELYIPRNKSLTIRMNPNIPDVYLPAFILGYSDGNGTISHRHRHVHAQCLEYSIVMGSRCMAEDLYSALLPIAKGRVRERRNYYLVSWGSSVKAEAVLDYLYQARPSFCLERKYQKYMGWKNRVVYPHANKTWTDEEKRFVQQNMNTMMQKEIAMLLGKTVSSVGMMIWRLKNGTVKI